MFDALVRRRPQFFLGRLLMGRPRLFTSLALSLVAYALLPFRGSTSALLAWNLFTWLYLAFEIAMIAGSDAQTIRWRAAATDDTKWVILALTLTAAVISLGAILAEIGIAKDLKGTLKALHLALAGVTILSAWIFIHFTFAMHYAHEFFDETKSEPGERPKLRGGLVFPDTDDPDYWDFLYFSFVIGVASQTADVSISSKQMRRTSLGHSVLSFFFNSAILALTINIAAGLI